MTITIGVQFKLPTAHSISMDQLRFVERRQMRVIPAGTSGAPRLALSGLNQGSPQPLVTHQSKLAAHHVLASAGGQDSAVWPPKRFSIPNPKASCSSSIDGIGSGANLSHKIMLMDSEYTDNLVQAMPVRSLDRD
jgi:hypothetical protein